MKRAESSARKGTLVSPMDFEIRGFRNKRCPFELHLCRSLVYMPGSTLLTALLDTLQLFSSVGLLPATLT